NRTQQRHRLLAFSFAVIKKYDEDETGRQAALLTYYGFLSLFPLLLVLTTLTGFIATSHSELHASIVEGMTNYFPVLGSQLSSHVNTLQDSGLALVVGILFTLYGARGVADAFRHSIQDFWKIPKRQRPGFPKSTFQSIIIILIAGLGFVVASLSIAVAGAASHGLLLKVLTIAINLGIWAGLFVLLLNISLPRHVPFKETRAAALTAAVGLVILQTLGGYLLKRELQHLDALYSYFAVALGLLFWIYLQVQVVFYALQIAAVGSQRLWPRSISGDSPTRADKIAQKNSGF
ncbi:MAG TPA: YhjD/YihY/BrkB family envelope integrity protein, partial [Candidatus Saccharimonadales bacterium]|nr:YhjD/YihY/BrkB family envelope integrity protein [Candidatus Saccharimonadales bacterium]